MMIHVPPEDGWFEVGMLEEEPRYYPAPWNSSLLLPSVTTIKGIIKNRYVQRWRADLGTEKANMATHNAADYGTAIHDLTAVMDMVGGGMEIIGRVPDDMVQQLTDYVKWRRSHVERIIEVEMTVYSKRYLYAGRLDRVLIMIGDKGLSLWDIKTGTIQGIDRAQTAAYSNAYTEMTGEKIVRRGLIEVSRRTGRVKPHEHTDPNDFKGFLSMLNTYRWLESVGEI